MVKRCDKNYNDNAPTILKNQYSKIQIKSGTTWTSKEIAMGSGTEEDCPFPDNQLHPQGAYL